MSQRRRHELTPLIALLAVAAFSIALGFAAGSASGNSRPARQPDPAPAVTVTVPGPRVTVTDPPQGPLPSETAVPVVRGNG